MTRKDITGVYKRFLITFLCMLPVLIGLGFLLDGKVSDVVMIIIYVVVAGAVVAIEEYIHFKRKKRREMLKEQNAQNYDNKKSK